MWYVFEIFVNIWQFAKAYRGALGPALLATFSVFNFIYTYFTEGLTAAYIQLSQTFFAAEYKIHEAVSLAIDNSPRYTLSSFIDIILGILVIYYFIKFVGYLMLKISGSTADWGSYFIALIIFAVVELSTVKITTGSFEFIPLWDGIIYLLLNLKPVLYNINWFGLRWPIENVETVKTVVNVTQNATNVTN